jgi:hypothetical protein
LGCYNEELDAAEVYDWVALKTRGADARINFPASNYHDADGNLLKNERLNRMVIRHQQLIDAAKKQPTLVSTGSHSGRFTTETAAKQHQRPPAAVHKAKAMAPASQVQSEAPWDFFEQQTSDMPVLCGRSAAESQAVICSKEHKVMLARLRKHCSTCCAAVGLPPLLPPLTALYADHSLHLAAQQGKASCPCVCRHCQTGLCWCWFSSGSRPGDFPCLQVFSGALAAVSGAVGQCSQQQQPPNQIGKVGQQLVLEELQSRMLSEQLSHQLTDRLFEQPNDADYLLSQLLLDRGTAAAPPTAAPPTAAPPTAASLLQQPQQQPQQQQQVLATTDDLLEQLEQQLQQPANMLPPQAASSAGFTRTQSWPTTPARVAAGATAAAVNNSREGGQLRNTYWPHRHHIDMSDMASKLPSGAFLQQIVTGPYGMYGLVYGCPNDQTWGAGVWDGMDWHSIGSYINEADALTACCFVVDVGTTSCPSDDSDVNFEEECLR